LTARDTFLPLWDIGPFGCSVLRLGHVRGLRDLCIRTCHHAGHAGMPHSWADTRQTAANEAQQAAGTEKAVATVGNIVRADFSPTTTPP
jgi:hypothetical protein